MAGAGNQFKGNALRRRSPPRRPTTAPAGRKPAAVASNPLFIQPRLSYSGRLFEVPSTVVSVQAPDHSASAPVLTLPSTRPASASYGAASSNKSSARPGSASSKGSARLGFPPGSERAVPPRPAAGLQRPLSAGAAPTRPWRDGAPDLGACQEPPSTEMAAPPPRPVQRTPLTESWATAWEAGEAAALPSADAAAPRSLEQRLLELQRARARLLRRAVPRTDLVPDRNEPVPPTLIPEPCQIRQSVPQPPPPTVDSFECRPAAGGGWELTVFPMRNPRGSLDVAMLEHWVEEMLAAQPKEILADAEVHAAAAAAAAGGVRDGGVGGGAESSAAMMSEHDCAVSVCVMALHELGRACGAARGALLRRLMARALGAVEARAEARCASLAAQLQAAELHAARRRGDEERGALGEALSRAAHDRDARLDATRSQRLMEGRARSASQRAAHAENEAAALQQIVARAASLLAEEGARLRDGYARKLARPDSRLAHDGEAARLEAAAAVSPIDKIAAMLAAAAAPPVTAACGARAAAAAATAVDSAGRAANALGGGAGGGGGGSAGVGAGGGGGGMAGAGGAAASGPVFAPLPPTPVPSPSLAALAALAATNGGAAAAGIVAPQLSGRGARGGVAGVGGGGGGRPQRPGSARFGGLASSASLEQESAARKTPAQQRAAANVAAARTALKLAGVSDAAQQPEGNLTTVERLTLARADAQAKRDALARLQARGDATHDRRPSKALEEAAAALEEAAAREAQLVRELSSEASREADRRAALLRGETTDPKNPAYRARQRLAAEATAEAALLEERAKRGETALRDLAHENDASEGLFARSEAILRALQQPPSPPPAPPMATGAAE